MPASLNKIVDREASEKLLALVRMGKARVVKEYVNHDPEIFIYSASGTLIAMIGMRYRYLFEAELIKHGSGDGLLEGYHQTTAIP